MKKTSKLKGIISLSPKGTGYVEIEGWKDDIEIDARHLKTALHGDEVEIILHPARRGRRQSGEVVNILSRKKKGFAGVLVQEKKTFLVEPDDICMYANILIQPKNIAGAKVGEKVFAEILSWENRDRLPEGKITRVFGKTGENNAEMLSIAKERGFDETFPQDVVAEAKNIKSAGIQPEDCRDRRDFRDTLTFTIDPDDAKDFDDAISFRILPSLEKEGAGGGELYEIGIHIADVTHYVRPGSALDREARERGTSVYLVDRTIPMLPEELSNDLCSLVPKQDRLVMSAVFVMDQNARIHESWFGRSVIHSDKRFTYADAEKSIKEKTAPLHRELSTLNSVAKKMTHERTLLGAMLLDSEEVKFVLDQNGVPLEVIKKTYGDANKLVEEFMLLANRKVAEAVSGKKPARAGGKDRIFVYRVHDYPAREKMENLHFFLKSLGYKVTLKNGTIPTAEINKILESLAGKNERDAVHRAVIRSMAKAIYSTQNIGHYGLAFEHYTHFTSPIRRYPDMLVHRFLSEFLSGHKTPTENLKNFEAIARAASEREKSAADAERASIKYKQAEYMSSRIGEVFEGVISGVSEWGIFIEELQTKCEGLVRMRDLKDDFYVLNEKRLEIVGGKTKTTYKLGDRVKIKVSRVDLERKTIDYKLV